MTDLNYLLRVAAHEGETLECVNLIERGADVGTLDPRGWSTLNRAAWNGHTGTCLALIERGANIEALAFGGRNSLHLAASAGHSSTCLALLECGSDPQARDFDGHTALDLVIAAQKQECVDILRSFTAANAARQALQEITTAASPGP